MVKIMDIKEIKEEKAKFEGYVADLVAVFNKKTGMLVDTLTPEYIQAEEFGEEEEFCLKGVHATIGLK